LRKSKKVDQSDFQLTEAPVAQIGILTIVAFSLIDEGMADAFDICARDVISQMTEGLKSAIAAANIAVAQGR